MDNEIKSVEEVRAFLKKVHVLAQSEEHTMINSRSWAGKVNKTRQYMAETGIRAPVIRQIVRELRVCNYSSTKDDKNDNYINEKVWIFGITKNIVDQNEDLYIKLKIKKFEEDELLIMSFHPEQPMKAEDKLKFPYKNIMDEIKYE